MNKKMILLICTFFSTNVHTSSDTCLNQQETLIYKEIIHLHDYTLIGKSLDEKLPFIQKFIQEKNISISELYTILEKQLPCVNEDLRKVELQISWRQPHGELDRITGLFSFGSLALGATLFALGFTVKQYVTTLSSIKRNVLGYGIGALGMVSLIPEIALESTKDGIIMGGIFPAIHEFITHASEKRGLLYHQKICIENLQYTLRRLIKRSL